MKDINGVDIKEYDILKATIFFDSTVDSDKAADTRRYIHCGFVLNINLTEDSSKDCLCLTSGSAYASRYPLNQEFIDMRRFKIIDSLKTNYVRMPIL